MRDALEGGPRLLTGGHAHTAGAPFYLPTVLTDVDPNALLCHEETLWTRCRPRAQGGEAEAIQLANASRAGLASYVFTSDLNCAHRVTDALDFGMVGLNAGLIFTEAAPFGGCKESGIGSEGSRHVLQEFQELKD